MYLCMYLYIFVYICVCICIYLYIFVYICLYVLEYMKMICVSEKNNNALIYYNELKQKHSTEWYQSWRTMIVRKILFCV